MENLKDANGGLIIDAKAMEEILDALANENLKPYGQFMVRMLGREDFPDVVKRFVDVVKDENALFSMTVMELKDLTKLMRAQLDPDGDGRVSASVYEGYRSRIAGLDCRSDVQSALARSLTVGLEGAGAGLEFVSKTGVSLQFEDVAGPGAADECYGQGPTPNLWQTGDPSKGGAPTS